MLRGSLGNEITNPLMLSTTLSVVDKLAKYTSLNEKKSLIKDAN